MTLEKLQDIKDSCKWEYFKDINGLRENGELAYSAFAADFKERGNSRYIDVEFPETHL